MKKSLSLSVKMGIIVGISIVASALAVEILCLGLFKTQFTKNIRENLETTAQGIVSTLGDWSDIAEYAIVGLASNPNLIEAFEDGNDVQLAALAQEKKDIVGLDILVAVDARGKLLTGSNRGSDVSAVMCIKDIIVDGLQTAHTFESATTIGYSMLVSTAVKNAQGRLVGILVGGYDFTAQSFINKMSQLYDVQITAFDNTLRVSTTIRDSSGRSWVGSRIDNQQVISQVLNNGATYSTVINLLGTNYLNVYFPLKTELGKITGMLAVARSVETINSVVNFAIEVSIGFLIVLCVILCLLSGILIVRMLHPLKSVNATFDDICSGDADLTKRITISTHDEIGAVVHGFNQFADKLQHIISEMKNSKHALDIAGMDLLSASEDTTKAVTTILANIESIYDQVNGQKQSVEQTAGAVDEISANITALNHMIENQSSGVTEASAAVEEMIGNIRSVNVSMAKMSNSFNDLQEHSHHGFDKLAVVGERVQEIEQQSKMLQEANTAIASIASQTNLLAMNAAIEAAHAGEAGKGFAVVADEIRKLSETSTQQSKTIGQQLGQIKDAIVNVVSASTESSQVFSQVQEELQATDQLVMQIRAAMEEQNEGSRQITEALKLMNDATVEVRNASVEMNEGNKVILEEVQHLQDVTIVMKQSMDEMHVGAHQISKTGTMLTDVTDRVKQSIDKMGSQVDLFTV